MLHTVAYLELRPQTLAPALKCVERWLSREGRVGALHACWYSNLGPANRIMVWRGFDGEEVLIEEQHRLARSDDPFGAADYLAGLSSDVFREIDFVGPPSHAVRGPLFEVRDYVLRPDGLARLFELWRAGLPARLALAPWVTALYSLAGATPRVLHMYPWESLTQRNAIRDGATAVNWPPRDAPMQINLQEATIYLASAVSPIQ